MVDTGHRRGRHGGGQCAVHRTAPAVTHGRASMVDAKDWREMHEWSAQLLRRQTGQTVEDWNRRVRETGIDSRDALQQWLVRHDINGYAQQLLIMERFGYPDLLVKTAEE